MGYSIELLVMLSVDLLSADEAFHAFVLSKIRIKTAYIKMGNGLC